MVKATPRPAPSPASMAVPAPFPSSSRVPSFRPAIQPAIQLEAEPDYNEDERTMLRPGLNTPPSSSSPRIASLASSAPLLPSLPPISPGSPCCSPTGSAVIPVALREMPSDERELAAPATIRPVTLAGGHRYPHLAKTMPVSGRTSDVGNAVITTRTHVLAGGRPTDSWFAAIMATGVFLRSPECSHRSRRFRRAPRRDGSLRRPRAHRARRRGPARRDGPARFDCASRAGTGGHVGPTPTARSTAQTSFRQRRTQWWRSTRSPVSRRSPRTSRVSIKTSPSGFPRASCRTRRPLPFSSRLNKRSKRSGATRRPRPLRTRTRSSPKPPNRCSSRSPKRPPPPATPHPFTARPPRAAAPARQAAAPVTAAPAPAAKANSRSDEVTKTASDELSVCSSSVRSDHRVLARTIARCLFALFCRLYGTHRPRRKSPSMVDSLTQRASFPNICAQSIENDAPRAQLRSSVPLHATTPDSQPSSPGASPSRVAPASAGAPPSSTAGRTMHATSAPAAAGASRASHSPPGRSFAQSTSTRPAEHRRAVDRSQMTVRPPVQL